VPVSLRDSACNTQPSAGTRAMVLSGSEIPAPALSGMSGSPDSSTTFFTSLHCTPAGKPTSVNTRKTTDTAPTRSANVGPVVRRRMLPSLLKTQGHTAPVAPDGVTQGEPVDNVLGEIEETSFSSLCVLYVSTAVILSHVWSTVNRKDSGGGAGRMAESPGQSGRPEGWPGSTLRKVCTGPRRRALRPTLPLSGTLRVS
jgi:hypothetical protein